MKMRKIDPNAAPIKARYNKKVNQVQKKGKRGKKQRKGSQANENRENGDNEDSHLQGINWFKEMPLCEDIKIVELEKLPPSDMKEFENKCIREIMPAKYDQLKSRISTYKNNKISEGELFNDFQKIFGNKDAFEFFGYFIKTCKSNIYYSLEDELIYRCNKLRTENLCILKNNKSFTDLFKKIEDNLVENIFERFEVGLLNSKKPAKKNQMVLFQYFGVLKQMNKGEVIKFKYLNRFFESEKSIEIILESLFIPKSNFKKKISELNNIDIILAFLYFHIGAQKLKGMNVKLDTAKVNPNLNKIFLRHFPEFGRDHKIKMESDEEDYEVEIKKPTDVEEENPLTLNQIPVINKSTNQRKKYSAKQVFVTSHDKKVDENTIRLDDLSNKFDFPKINEDMSSVPTKKPDDEEKKDGWGDSSQFLYKRNDLSNKEMNQFFPTLGGPPVKKQTSVAVKKKGKKKGKKKQPQVNPMAAMSNLNSLYGGSAFDTEAFDPIGGMYGGVPEKEVPMTKQVPKQKKNKKPKVFKSVAPMDPFAQIGSSLNPIDVNNPVLAGNSGNGGGKFLKY